MSRAVEEKKTPARGPALGQRLWACKSDEEALALVQGAGARAAKARALDESGQTPLMKAALKGFSKTCAALVAAGADPSRRSRHGESPLTLAAIGGHLEAFKALLAAGAQVDEIDDDGNGVFHKVANSGAGEGRETAILAASLGARPDRPNHRGLRPVDMLRELGFLGSEGAAEFQERLAPIWERAEVERSATEPTGPRQGARRI